MSTTSQEMLATSGMSNPEDWLIASIGGSESWSGVTVNERSVLSSGPIYQAVTIISSTLAALPIDVKRKQPDGKRVEEENHPAAIIWNHVGNDEMIPYAVRQTLLAWALIHGNGLGLIEFKGGRPVGVHPLPPGSVWLDRRQKEDDRPGFPTGDLIYGWIDSTGTAQVLWPWEVFHFKLLGNGLWGASPLQLFQNTFGNGIGLQKFQGKHFSNDARPSGVLTTDAKLRGEARQNLRREWNEQHQGLDNAAKVAVLAAGVQWSPMSVTNEQAQMLESRKFYREEVAAVYNLPPHMLGAMENSAVRANIEEQNRSFVRQTLIPHDTTWGQESIWKLGSERDRSTRSVTIQHDFKALLRGDIKTQADATAVNRQWGLTSANDERRERGMDEIGTEGDSYMVPTNMADAATGLAYGASGEEGGLNLVEAVQKVYLGVGTVLTSDEARQILNDDHGADLPMGVDVTVDEPPAQPNQFQTADVVAFARQKLHKIQAIEMRNHRNNMHRKPKLFGENVASYYETFGGYLMEEMQPLVMAGFDADSVKSAVDCYVSTSKQALSDVQDAENLQTTLGDWPARVEGLVSDFLKGPDDEKGI